MILQTAFTDLIQPQELTTALALFIVAYLTLTAYLGYRLRHAAILFFWFIMVTVLVLIIMINLSFLWFWLTVLINALVIALAGIFRFLLEPMLSD